MKFKLRRNEKMGMPHGRDFAVSIYFHDIPESNVFLQSLTQSRQQVYLPAEQKRALGRNAQANESTCKLTGYFSCSLLDVCCSPFAVSKQSAFVNAFFYPVPRLVPRVAKYANTSHVLIKCTQPCEAAGPFLRASCTLGVWSGRSVK